MEKNKITPQCVLYQGTIVDDNMVVVCSDGSSYIQSDISMVKNLNVNSSTALAEALSMRMQMRDGSGVTGVSDDDLIASTKPRGTQDKTEIDAYNGYIRAGVIHDGNITNGSPDDVPKNSDNVVVVKADDVP